jgi:hypothetical protein
MEWCPSRSSLGSSDAEEFAARLTAEEFRTYRGLARERHRVGCARRFAALANQPRREGIASRNTTRSGAVRSLVQRRDEPCASLIAFMKPSVV